MLPGTILTFFDENPCAKNCNVDRRWHGVVEDRLRGPHDFLVGADLEELFRETDGKSQVT